MTFRFLPYGKYGTQSLDHGTSIGLSDPHSQLYHTVFYVFSLFTERKYLFDFFRIIIRLICDPDYISADLFISGAKGYLHRNSRTYFLFQGLWNPVLEMSVQLLGGNIHDHIRIFHSSPPYLHLCGHSRGL